jgi:hypothetical protein
MKSKMSKLQNFLSTHIPLVSWDYEGYKDSKYPESMHQTDWNQTLCTKINQTSATIFQDTNHGGANVILIPSNMEDIFKTLEYLTVSIERFEGYYKLGSLAGRYIVFVVPKLTRIKINYHGADNQLKEVDFDQDRVFVCKLKDVAKILDIKNYIKVGVVKVNKPYNLFE